MSIRPSSGRGERPSGVAIASAVARHRLSGLAKTAAGRQVTRMRSAVTAAWRWPSAVKVRSTRPRNLSGEMPSTWPWRTRMILVIRSSFSVARCSGYLGIVLCEGSSSDARRPQSSDLDRRKPVYPPQRQRRRRQHNKCQFLAHHNLPGGTRTRALSPERADREPLADLLRQHRNGAVAAVDRPGHAQRRDGRYDNPGGRRSVRQIGRPALFLDGTGAVAGRANRPHLVSDRRAAADPHRAQCRARPALWGVHAADPGARRAAHPKRRRSGRPAVATRARGETLQHLRVGVLRELDRSPLEGEAPARPAAWERAPGYS